jgi:hypothetical protein
MAITMSVGYPLGVPELTLVQHLPFQFPGERKALFGFKLFLYMASGFSIPFLAARYQL